MTKKKHISNPTNNATVEIKNCPASLIHDYTSEDGSVFRSLSFRWKDALASPITQIEKSFHLEHGFIRKHILKSADLDAITEAAFKSRLGMRAINSKIKEQVNNYIFDNYKKIYPDRIAEYKSTL